MPREDSAERWYRKAERDLAAAEHLLKPRHPPVLAEIVAFHAQQAAEKWLKGWLESRGMRAPRTHDLDRLVNRASRLEPTFQNLMKAAAGLSDYAVTPRYPGATPEPTEADAVRAVENARAVRDFVERLRPPRSQPDLPLE